MLDFKFVNLVFSKKLSDWTQIDTTFTERQRLVLFSSFCSLASFWNIEEVLRCQKIGKILEKVKRNKIVIIELTKTLLSKNQLSTEKKPKFGQQSQVFTMRNYWTNCKFFINLLIIYSHVVRLDSWLQTAIKSIFNSGLQTKWFLKFPSKKKLYNSALMGRKVVSHFSV